MVGLPCVKPTTPVIFISLTEKRGTDLAQAPRFEIGGGTAAPGRSGYCTRNSSLQSIAKGF